MVVRLLTFRLLGSRLAAALALGGPAGPLVQLVGFEVARAIGWRGTGSPPGSKAATAATAGRETGRASYVGLGVRVLLTVLSAPA